MKALLALLAGAVASVPPAPDANFVACPIYRDTDAGRKSGCWLADDPATGARYDVTQSAVKPDWNFAILVEGRMSTALGNPCGGVVLEPIRVSVLEDLHCTRHLIPAEGFPGRKFVLPKRNVDPAHVARPKPQPPFADRTFRLFFDWNSDFLAYQREDYSLDQIITWLRAVPVKRVTITGYSAQTPNTVSGHAMAEDMGLARQRAEHVAEALVRLGIPKSVLATQDGGDGRIVRDDWVDNLPQSSRRRVDIAVELMTP